MNWIRALVVALVFCVGLYVAGHFRTQSFGFTFGPVLLAMLFVGPLASIPFFGIRLLDMAIGTAALWIAIVGTVEAMAAWEEYRFRQQCQLVGVREAEQWFVKPRLWPHEGHSMWFQVQGGRFGAWD
ncbi:MAG: hypothetical protein U0744_20330 [Gemmataceae bacterium]